MELPLLASSMVTTLPVLIFKAGVQVIHDDSMDQLRTFLVGFPKSLQLIVSYRLPTTVHGCHAANQLSVL